VDGGRVSEPDGFRDFVVARSPALIRSAWLLTGTRPGAAGWDQSTMRLMPSQRGIGTYMAR